MRTIPHKRGRVCIAVIGRKAVPKPTPYQCVTLEALHTAKTRTKPYLVDSLPVSQLRTLEGCEGTLTTEDVLGCRSVLGCKV